MPKKNVSDAVAVDISVEPRLGRMQFSLVPQDDSGPSTFSVGGEHPQTKTIRMGRGDQLFLMFSEKIDGPNPDAS